MKYRIKEYPELLPQFETMSVDDLLRSIICPDIQPGKTPAPRNTNSVFAHAATTEVANKTTAEINDGRENPALIVADMEYGASGAIVGAVEFPSMKAAAMSGDSRLAYEMGVIAAKEAINAGFHWTFGPCVDIMGNPHNPIVPLRTPGEDTDTVIEYGGAYMRGLQDNGLIATLKHFPGDGYSFDDQHITVTENPLSKEEWDASFGRVYATLIEQGAMSIMPGHIALPAYDEADQYGLYPPATVSKNLLTGLLKEKLGFEGLIVSDALTMGGFCGYMNYYHGCAAFLEAGGDCLVFVHESEEFLREMKKCIAEGRLSMDTLRNRAYRMACFARDYFENHPSGQKVELDREKAEAVAEEMTDKAVKVVRDRRSQLPVKIDKTTKIAHVVLYNSWCPDFFQVENLTAELRKVAGQVDELRDPGSRELLRIAKSGEYDLILCSVIEYKAWGINTARLCGPIVRNMMNGWMHYGTPTVFVAHMGTCFEATYKPVVDTLINTYGTTKYTASAVIRRLQGE